MGLSTACFEMRRDEERTCVVGAADKEAVRVVTGFRKDHREVEFHVESKN